MTFTTECKGVDLDEADARARKISCFHKEA